MSLEEAILGAVDALGLMGTAEQAEADLAKLLRETAMKPQQRSIVIRVLRCCARLSATEPYLTIEAEARDFSERTHQRAQAAAERLVAQTKNTMWSRDQMERERIAARLRELALKEADCERRRQEMTSPHAPALALLQSILAQYPIPYGERLPPTAFLSACALVASLMGTNPVDLALHTSSGRFEFKP